MARDFNVTRYSFWALFVPEGEGKFSVLFPDLPGCQTWGDTMDEATEQASKVLQAHLEGILSDGEAVPLGMRYSEAQAECPKILDKLGLAMPQGIEIKLVAADVEVY